MIRLNPFRRQVKPAPSEAAKGPRRRPVTWTVTAPPWLPVALLVIVQGHPAPR